MRNWLDLIGVLTLLTLVPLLAGCPARSGSGVTESVPLANGTSLAGTSSAAEGPSGDANGAAGSSGNAPLVAATGNYGGSGGEVGRVGTGDTGNSGRPATDPASAVSPVDPSSAGPNAPNVAGTPPARPDLPLVEMSAEHQSKLFLRVGDKFPPLRLLNLAGDEIELLPYFGEKATVVLFWGLKDPYAFEAYRSVGADLPKSQELGDLGILTINYDDPPREILSKVPGDQPPVFLASPDAPELPLPQQPKLPQIYVLDGNGRVVWCDIEYSRNTRIHMTKSLQHLLLSQAE